MGLLDYLAQPTSQPGGLFSDDPTAMLSLAANLFQGRRGDTFGNIGKALAGATQTYQADQQQERANRASDLQQVMGLYNIAKNRDLAQWYSDTKAGIPHVADPQLGVLEQKIASLSGVPQLAGRVTPPLAPQSPPSQGAQSPTAITTTPTLPPSQASQYSPVVAPEFRAQGPMPSPQSAPQMPQRQQPADPMQNLRDQADIMAIMSNHPELAAENLYKRSMPLVSRGVSFDASTGMPLGGMVDNIPTQMVNGRMTIIPNDLTPAMAQRAGAVEGAKQAAEFPYRVTNVKMASGAEMPALLSSVVGNPAGGFMTGPPANAPKITRTPSPQLPAQPAAQPGQPASVAPTATQPSSNADPWTTVPKRQIPQGIGQTTFDATMARNQADTASKLVDKYGASADAANNRIALNNQALSLVDQADTGTLAAKVGAVKNALVTVGIPESSFANTPSADQALQKDLLNAATQRAKQQFGSRITQSEVQLMLTRGSPNQDMQKAAIKYLLGSDNAMSQYAIQQSSDLGHYLQIGGDPNRFEGWHAQAFPATHALGELHLSASPSNVVKLPSGKTATFPSADAAAAFKKQAGIQ